VNQELKILRVSLNHFHLGQPFPLPYVASACALNAILQMPVPQVFSNENRFRLFGGLAGYV